MKIKYFAASIDNGEIGSDGARAFFLVTSAGQYFRTLLRRDEDNQFIREDEISPNYRITCTPAKFAEFMNSEISNLVSAEMSNEASTKTSVGTIDLGTSYGVISQMFRGKSAGTNKPFHPLEPMRIPMVWNQLEKSAETTNDDSYKNVSDGIADIVKKNVLKNFEVSEGNFMGSNKIYDLDTSNPVFGSNFAVADTVMSERLIVDGNEKFIRPNGEAYRPRDFNGHTDVAFLRRMREMNIPVRLEGPPGAGKTALVEASFPDCITVNGNGDMTVAHFVGSYRPVTREGSTGWVWEDGPLVLAMRAGVPFFVDEGNRVPNEALNILFAAMDGRSEIRIDDRPDDPIVKAVEGFYVVMGYNPDTLSSHMLDEALVSRFRMMIRVETDNDTALALNVPHDAVKVADKMVTLNKESMAVNGAGYWVPQMRELLTFRDLINAGVGEDVAFANLFASCPDEDSKSELRKAIRAVSKFDVSVPALGGSV